LKASNISSKSELLCIAALQEPLLGEPRPYHGHFIAWGERPEIFAIERLVIVFQPDEAPEVGLEPTTR
jgi:hypothetical protein